VTKATAGNGKKGEKKEKGSEPSMEAKEPEPMKTGTESEESTTAEAPPEEKGKADEQKTEQLLKENEELQDKFLRLMADFDNYKKRATKEKSDVIQFGNEGLLKDLLPIIDNIERLLTYSYREGSWKSFQEGIELLLTEISRTLAKYGVEPIEALGKPFDPNLHQAMQRSETDEAEADTVVEVYQKGDLYRGRLLRPARVVVAVTPKGEDEKKGEEDAAGPAVPNGEKEGAGDKEKDEETPVN
jgi:molecular chaperone GrpE